MSDTDNIELKAAEWLVERDAAGGLENSSFTAWLAADPRHRAAYLRLAAAWQRTGQLRRLVPEGSVVDANLLLTKPRHPLRLWLPMAFAAGLAALALPAVWWFQPDRGEKAYRTDVGGLSRVVLADGSTMTLNTDTEARVQFVRQSRRVVLIRGEAQFEVVHDETRPFEVAAGRRIVRDVGTSFDIRLDRDEALRVIVTEGQIALEDAKALQSGEAGPTASVSAGESAVAKAGVVTISRMSTTETSRHLAWEVGELSFQGETLQEAIAEFNRYNHLKLMIVDPKIAELAIGGNFEALDVRSFVDALEHSFNVKATTSDDGTILLRGSPNLAH